MPDLHDVSPPVALVTGAGRGLGAAVAAALDAAGFRLVLTDIAVEGRAAEDGAAAAGGVADVITADRADSHQAGAGSADRGPAAAPAADAVTIGTATADAVTVDTVADGGAVTRQPLRYPVSTRADLESVAASCREAVALAADVRVQEDLDRAVRCALSRFGRLDAAIAVAGVIAGGPPLWETDDTTWKELIDVNLTGVFQLARAAVPALLESPAGRFVAVSSAAGTRPLGRLAAYSASKHAVVGLVRSLAADLAGTSVTANVVCPGSMDTRMLAESARVYDLADPREFAAHAYLRRLLDPAEVAAMIAFLCSPAASGITGAVVPVDGGFTG